ncbi:glycosyl hydrolase [Paenibacillus xanthanilyticus]|uniref:Glycosyl hydrolase n=1 Tax=Paenibacillus xanthanilyticus TaxID=1783531 RepID=A0ABV8K8P7_9BACL
MPAAHSSSTIVRYEDAILQGYGVEKLAAPQDGDSLYDGEGYVSFFYDFDPASSQPDGTATFKVEAAAAGLYALSLGYYIPEGYGAKEAGIRVNGTDVGGITLDAPPASTVVHEKMVSKIALNAGTNEVTFTRGWGYYGIEYVRIEPAGLPFASSTIEAEDGLMSGEVSLGSAVEGFSGSGYAAFKSSGSLTLSYNAAERGLVELTIGYSAPYGDKKTQLTVNGQASEVSLPSTSSYAEATGGKVMMNKGTNTIRFDSGWGWYNIDYVKLSPASASNQHQVENKLVNANATVETKALMRYFVDHYGRNILSGQQTLEDAQWIKDQTGKYPAIFSTDLIDYSPSRVEHGAASTEVDKAIQWAKEGGIVALVWHWNAPAGLYDTAGKEWWRGFYTDSTSFDVQYALSHPDSEDYRLLLRDIDAIADQLKRLQDARVPVLWRPLHEAEGGWFWWGAKGPEPAKQLYRLMYDRLTNTHRLNNLIWVWNSESPDWYPGDDVVDMVSVDIYNPAGNYGPSIAKYDSLVNLVQDKKLVALPENGPIPDPEQLQTYAAHWLFFSTWTGDFIRDGKYNTMEHIQKVYSSDYVITRDELPDDLYTSFRYEAEKGTMTGLTVSTAGSGYSGDGYVTGFDEDGNTLAMTVNVPVSGRYTLSIRYKAQGDKTNPVLLNDETLADYVFKNSDAWTDGVVGEYELQAGNPTLRIGKSWGWIDVDFAELQYLGPILPKAVVSYSSANPTNQDVIAQLTANKPVTITNNGGSNRYVFKQNGSFTFTYIDADGHTGSVTATVTNIDKTPPSFSVTADRTVLQTPNHALVPINLQWTAHDADSGVAGVQLASVTSSEPDNGSGDGDKDQDIQDAKIGTADAQIKLRAERSGKGNGRVYTITYKAFDHAGNQTTASVLVTVPHGSKS